MKVGGTLAGLCLWLLLAPSVRAQSSPFGRRDESTPKKDSAARKPASPAAPDGEPHELSREEIDQALQDLDAGDSGVRQSAFDKLIAAGKESKARTRLRSLLKKWLSNYRMARKAALDRARPRGGDIAAKRRRALDLLKQGDTKSMRPIVEEMFRMVYPDTTQANHDPEVRKAASRLREIESMLTRIGHAPRKSIDEQLKEIDTYLDENAILSCVPDTAAAVMSANRSRRSAIRPEEYRLVLITNMYRAMMGKNALRINVALCNATRMHSRDMKEHNFFSHMSPLPGKRTPQDRARMHGTFCSAENIYRGGTTAEGAFWSWFSSLGHHRNMIGPHSQIGVGHHEGFWTEAF